MGRPVLALELSELMLMLSLTAMQHVSANGDRRPMLCKAQFKTLQSCHASGKILETAVVSLCVFFVAGARLEAHPTGQEGHRVAELTKDTTGTCTKSSPDS